MKQAQLILPALRGRFGSWVYYACLMPIEELGARVSYAEEIHPDKALSQLIQRSLEGPRARHIAVYVSSTKDRFFSSLVLATYGGSPEWLEVGNFRATSEPKLVKQISESALDSIGFLRLTGREKIFAIDGQHRLAGIKRALNDGAHLAQEVVPALLVGHKRDASGMRRTRRLFTTLNKTAVPVRKRDIIALDEDDVMAITARRLVEENPAFRDPKIAVISSQSLPVTNRVSLTTIANLYDILKLIFMHELGQRSDRSLRFNRPPDKRLDKYYATAVGYFDAVAKAFPPVRRLFSASNPGKVTTRYRGPRGGHLLFRPIGLEVLTRTAIAYSKEKEVAITQAIAKLADLPTDLAKPPFNYVLWDPAGRTMKARGKDKDLAVRLTSYMAGLGTDVDELLRDYRVAVGMMPDDTSVGLPAQVLVI